MTAVRVTHVDAFASAPFAGNPAVVCVMPAGRDEEWMQRMAREMNMPATTFVHAADGGFGLRWFTPSAELQLCGHGTLATAHVLYESAAIRPDETARFHTRNGILTAVRRGDWIELDFPALGEEPAPAPDGLAEALGANPKYVGRSRLDLLIELDSEDDVRTLKPDLAKLATIRTRGFIVTSAARPNTDVDFVSRFFTPSVGLAEDHVTGSSHCCLAPFWSKRLGKRALVARQLSARGGVLRLTADGDRVRIAGQAVTITRGELNIP